LRESAERFVARARPGTDPARWDALVALGWLDILVPEADGGFGGTCADAAVIAEALGFGLLAEPFVERAVHAVTGSIACARAVNAAEMLGIMRRALRDTIAHVNAREQFGKPLSALQVVRHRIADMHVECELAAAAVTIALDAADADTPARTRRVALGTYQAARSGRFVCESAVQLHGAMGLASETPVAVALARFTTLSTAYGDATSALQRYLEPQGT
jgi:alkylation response protein AidB-like acyl-CoA dehydrogenase